MRSSEIYPLCGNRTDSLEHITEQWLLEVIRNEHPEWVESNGDCPKCVSYYCSQDDAVKSVDKSARKPDKATQSFAQVN